MVFFIAIPALASTPEDENAPAMTSEDQQFMGLTQLSENQMIKINGNLNAESAYLGPCPPAGGGNPTTPLGLLNATKNYWSNGGGTSSNCNTANDCGASTQSNASTNSSNDCGVSKPQ
jgi:hypothetical protein